MTYSPDTLSRHRYGSDVIEEDYVSHKQKSRSVSFGSVGIPAVAAALALTRPLQGASSKNPVPAFDSELGADESVAA
jgi:hypothetical protein